MTVEKLKALNPEIEFYTIDSPEFADYGRRVTDIDPAEIIKVAGDIELPVEGTKYYPSVEAFEKLKIAQDVKNLCYGELECQMGYCCGHNSRLNAWEWHTGSEINVAVTDLVLILAKLGEVKDNKIDSSKAKAFLLKKGDVAEVYATTLHFAPCQVQDSGFGSVVGLPKGTNTPLEGKYADKRLFAKNKWVLTHKDNKRLTDQGAYIGISGKNLEIKY